MTPVLYAWAATILFGFGGIVAKLASKYHINNPWLYNFVWTTCIVLFTVPICLYFGVGWPTDWVSIHIAGFLSAVCGALYILAMSKIDVSILSPLSNLRIPFMMLAGYLLFAERLPGNSIIYITLITVAGLILAIDEKFSIKSVVRPSMILAIISTIGAAMFNIASKYALMHNSYWDVMFWVNILTIPWTLLTIPLFIKDIRRTKVRAYKGVVASAAIVTIGMFAEFLALMGTASIAIAIISLPFSMMLAIILSVIAPQLLEKHSWKVYAIRIAAATVMFGSALMLSK